MKIKRFEAPNMAEALRMIKKEFGEEAVILSAKNVSRSARLFGTKGGGQVVVTAAIDQKAAGKDLQPQSNSTAETAPVADTKEKIPEGLGRILQRFTPISLTGKQKLQPKLVNLVSASQGKLSVCAPAMAAKSSVAGAAVADPSIYEMLVGQGTKRSTAAELSQKVAGLIPAAGQTHAEIVNALSQVIEVKGWISHLRAGGPTTPHILALAGPGGAGKTTTAAKIAARIVLQGRQTVAVLSLDDQRIAGTVELQRYAGIMGIQMETARDPDELTQALERLSTCQTIIVDTPGLSLDDAPARSALSKLLHHIGGAQVHLLLHAGMQEDIVARMIEWYKPLGITHLMPSHLDWSEKFGPFFNQMVQSRLPIAYMGVGPQVPEGIRTATAADIAAMLLSPLHTSLGFAQQRPAHANKPTQVIAQSGNPYIANRNSDIFHHQACKSVERISNGNMLGFKDSAEAMERGFKPCRMCCAALIVQKPIDRLARTQYASSRN